MIKIYFSHNLLLLLVVLTNLVLFGCQKNKVEESKNIEQKTSVNDKILDNRIVRISVLYFNSILEEKMLVNEREMTIDIPDFRVNKEGVLDAEITDSVKLDKIETLLKSLKDADKQSFPNVRILAHVIYKDMEVDTLVISGTYSDEIFVNGVKKEVNNELLFQLKNTIGFYPWIIGDGMSKMKELKDSSFPKGPFISDKYYKEYQTVLSEK